MKVENVKVYDLEESIKASKYPMATDIEKCTSDITKTTKVLGTSRIGKRAQQLAKWNKSCIRFNIHQQGMDRTAKVSFHRFCIMSKHNAQNS